MTRLLKIPIIGRFTAAVDSSCIDILAGLSKWPTLRMPPVFWASAAPAADNASDSEPAAASTRRPRFITFASCKGCELGRPAAASLLARLLGSPAKLQPPEANRIQSMRQ